MRKLQAGGSPPCVNGDIAIQWQWLNFDTSQNPKLLTDYDKTLHNPKFVPIGRKGASGQKRKI